MITINKAEVVHLLPINDCIIALEKAFMALGTKAAVQPLRSVVTLPGNPPGLLASMPGSLQIDGKRVFGLKAVSIFPQNDGVVYDTHNGAVLLFEGEHGTPVALIEGGALTQIRTAAASAVATKVLARNCKGMKVAILGNGVQAAGHIAAMLCVRQISHIRVWGRDLRKVQSFIQRYQAQYSSVVFTAHPTVDETVQEADIICTCTASTSPLLNGLYVFPPFVLFHQRIRETTRKRRTVRRDEWYGLSLLMC